MLLANSKKQLLSEHSALIAIVSQTLLQHLGIQLNSKSLQNNLIMASLFHDLGKVDPVFQYYIQEKTDNTSYTDGVHISVPDRKMKIDLDCYPRHNELSVFAVFEVLAGMKSFGTDLFEKGLIFLNGKTGEAYPLSVKDPENLEKILYVIKYHHAQLVRSSDDSSISKLCNSALENHPSKDFSKPSFFLNTVLNQSEQIIEKYNALVKLLGDSISLRGSEFPTVQLNSNIKESLQAAVTKRESEGDTFSTIFVKKEPLLEFKEELAKREKLLQEVKCKKECVTQYKQAVSEEAFKSLARSFLITADRLVSSLPCEKLSQLFTDPDELEAQLLEWVSQVKSSAQCEKESNLLYEISECSDRFNRMDNSGARNESQAKCVKQAYTLLTSRIIGDPQAATKNIAVIQGPAGCGKTKIMLELYHKLNKNKEQPSKLFIVVPRNAVGLGLFEELRSEKYLQKCSIEIATGSLASKSMNGQLVVLEESDFFKSDIVITTFDKVANLTMSHKNVSAFLALLQADVFIDEFHELFSIAGIEAIFQEFVNIKKRSNNSKICLVSATPTPFITKTLFDLSDSEFIRVNSFNEKPLFITTNEFPNTSSKEPSLNPMGEPQNPGALVVYNTASQAQNSSITNLCNQTENVLCVHSKLSSSDKDNVFRKLLSEFGEKAKGQPSDLVVRSGPILQASLNISSVRMITELSTAEEILQRLGRVNRFGFNSSGCLEVVYPATIKQSNAEGRLLSNLSKFHSTLIFKELLNRWTSVKSGILVNDAYSDYFSFHAKPEVQDAYLMDLLNTFRQSVTVFKRKDFTPTEFLGKKKKSKNKEEKPLSKLSLRSESVYALPLSVSFDIAARSAAKSFKGVPLSINLDQVTELKRAVERNLKNEELVLSLNKEGFELIDIQEDKHLKKADRLFKKALQMARFKTSPLLVFEKTEGGLIYLTLNFKTKEVPIGLISYEKLPSNILNAISI